ncbi:hypothetical protein HY251_00885 [bacterium]|nr:hypothetical protein [bacterium]
MICPYCRAELLAPEAVACRRCATPVHGACAEVHGRCVTFGCSSSGFVLAPGVRAHGSLATPVAPLTRHVRRTIAAAATVALAPLEDAALAALGTAGFVGLVLSLL